MKRYPEADEACALAGLRVVAMATGYIRSVLEDRRLCEMQQNSVETVGLLKIITSENAKYFAATNAYSINTSCYEFILY